MNDLVRDAAPKPLPHGSSQTNDSVDPGKPKCESPNSSDSGGPDRSKMFFPTHIFRFFCLSIDRGLSRWLRQGCTGMPVKRGYFEFRRRGFAVFPPLYSRRALSMRGSADAAGMPNVRSFRVFFRIEIAWQDQPPEMALESTSDFSHPEMHASCSPFFGTTFGHIISLPFLGSSSVAAFRSLNSDSRNGACFATLWNAREIIAPETPHSHTAFLTIRLDSPFEGERCMKDTVHHVVHLSVHPRIFVRVQRRRDCARRGDQFGHGQNTGLGWSDPTFVHVSVPKQIRGSLQPIGALNARRVLSAYGCAELRLRTRIGNNCLSQR